MINGTPIPRDQQSGRVKVRRDSDGFSRFWCPLFGHYMAVEDHEAAIAQASRCATGDHFHVWSRNSTVVPRMDEPQ